jgi:subtilase family serine protease
VPALAAGASMNRSFATYSYTCTGVSDSLKVKADANDAVSEGNEANNEYTKAWMCMAIIQQQPAVIVQFKPDLIITDVWSEGTEIHYKVKNQGVIDAGAFKCRLWIDGNYKTTEGIGALAKGTEIEQNFGGYTWICFIGDHDLRVVADVTDVIDESNETNNELIQTITCGL